MKKILISEDMLMKALDFINNYIITNKRLCTVKDISEGLEIKRHTAEKYIEALERKGYIVTVLNIRRKVKVVLPKEMANAIFSRQFIPTWAEDYRLPGEREILTELERLQTSLERYQKFRLLLMASGDALVHAVSYSLEFLGFTVIVTEKEGRHDIEFHDKDFYAIAEVKGLQGSADINDLRQLIDFHLRKLRERKNKLVAYLIVNHYRNLPPDKRGAPFTQEVINAVKTNYQFIRLLTTIDIYRLIEKVLRSEINKEIARETIKSMSSNNAVLFK